MTELTRAISNGDVDTIKTFVADGAEIMINDYMSLKLATYRGHLNVVMYLVSIGADITFQNYKVLEIAVKLGHLDIVNYFVSIGVKIRHALRVAILQDHLQIVEGLLYSEDHDVLTNAVIKGYLDVVEYLLTKYNNRDIDYNSLSGYSVAYGQFEIVQFLVSKGLYTKNTGNLRLASLNGHLKITEYIMSIGESLDYNNFEALKGAVRYNKFDIVKCLISADRRQRCREVALFAAATYGQLEIFDYIFNITKNVTMCGGDALVMAAREGHLCIVEYIIAHNIDTSNVYTRAVSYAAECGHLDVLKYLMNGV